MTVPAAQSNTVNLFVNSTGWMVPGEAIVVGDQAGNHATFVVNSILSPTQALVAWLNAPGDSAGGTVLRVSNGAYTAPGGFPGTAVSGTNAFTILTSNATIPLDLVTPVTFQVANSQWVTVGQTIVVGDATDGVATFKVTAVPDTTHVTALFLNARGDAGFGSPLLVANGASMSPSGSPEPIPLRVLTTGSVNPGSTGSDQTLMQVSVPAGTLNNPGDSIQIEAVFTIAATANNKTVKVAFGSTTLVTVGPAAQNTANSSVIVRARVVRVNLNTQSAYATALITTGGAMTAVTCLSTSPAETLSATVVVKGVGNAATATSDIAQTILMVRADTL